MRDIQEPLEALGHFLSPVFAINVLENNCDVIFVSHENDQTRKKESLPVTTTIVEIGDEPENQEDVDDKNSIINQVIVENQTEDQETLNAGIYEDIREEDVIHRSILGSESIDSNFWISFSDGIFQSRGQSDVTASRPLGHRRTDRGAESKLQDDKGIQWLSRSIKLQSMQMKCFRYQEVFQDFIELKQLTFQQVQGFLSVERSETNAITVGDIIIRINSEFLTGDIQKTLSLLRCKKNYPMRIEFCVQPQKAQWLLIQLRLSQLGPMFSFMMWKKRYVRIASGQIEYYRSGETNPSKVFSLRDAQLHLIPKRKSGCSHCIAIQLSRSYNPKRLGKIGNNRLILWIQFPNQADIESWGATILHAISMANGEIKNEIDAMEHKKYVAALRRINFNAA